MKNKEIEEILEGIKVVIKHNGTLEFDVKELKILLSYIEQLEAEIHKKEAMYDSLAVDYRLSQEQNEQLETDYKEANESVTWWTNRFSAVERDNRNLKNNRDKAIEYIERLDKDYDINVYQEDKHWAYILYILKGDSDDTR